MTTGPLPLRKAFVLPFLFVLTLAACSPRTDTRPEPPPKAPASAPAKTPSKGTPEKPRSAPKTKPSAPSGTAVQGFRVQIANSRTKADAEAALQDVIAWWESVPAGQRPKGWGDRSLDAGLTFKSPYYRVRVGAFRTQAEADAFRRLLVRRYPKALIAPDHVVVYD